MVEEEEEKFSQNGTFGIFTKFSSLQFISQLPTCIQVRDFTWVGGKCVSRKKNKLLKSDL